jgi:hypothetical protein
LTTNQGRDNVQYGGNAFFMVATPMLDRFLYGGNTNAFTSPYLFSPLPIGGNAFYIWWERQFNARQAATPFLDAPALRAETLV